MFLFENWDFLKTVQTLITSVLFIVEQNGQAHRVQLDELYQKHYLTRNKKIFEDYSQRVDDLGGNFQTPEYGIYERKLEKFLFSS